MQSQASLAMNSSSTIPNTQTTSYIAKKEKETYGRGKIDIAWGYCVEERTSNGERKLKCIYCNKVFSGGGITRMKKNIWPDKEEISIDVKMVPMIFNKNTEEPFKNTSKRKEQLKVYLRKCHLKTMKKMKMM